MRYATTDRLSDTELVAMVIGRKVDEAAVTRLATAMATDGWLSGGPLAEVVRERGGIGPKSVARLEAAVELGRRTLAARAARTATTISTPEDAVAVVRPLLLGQEREHFLALGLDVKNHLRRIIEVSIGSASASIVHPMSLFRDLVGISASSFVVLHNHPSQDPTPSGADIQLCRRIVKCADLMGCECLDFVVVGGDEFVSLRDQGLM